MVDIIENGDIFKSKSQTWVNTVNTVGVMGKGIALGFKRRFPEMYDDYTERCKRREVALGRPYLYKRVERPWILNFPTKDHWRQPANLAAIVEGLEHLERNYKRWGVESLAVPPLGCGEGQLEWRVVGPTLYRYLNRLEIPVELFAPFGTPHDELQPSYLEQLSLALDLEGSAEGRFTPASRIPVGWVTLVAILNEIESDRFHWPIGRITFQKLAYFANEAGIETSLEWDRGSFGPFAKNVKPMLARLINNGLLEETRLGQMFNIRVGPTFKDAAVAFASELEDSQESINKVADLFRRLRTRQAEIVATVHFVANELNARKGTSPSEAEVLNEALLWKARSKQPPTREELAEAIRHLALLGWVRVEASPDLLDEEELLGV